METSNRKRFMKLVNHPVNSSFIERLQQRATNRDKIRVDNQIHFKFLAIMTNQDSSNIEANVSFEDIREELVTISLHKIINNTIDSCNKVYKTNIDKKESLYTYGEAMDIHNLIVDIVDKHKEVK